MFSFVSSFPVCFFPIIISYFQKYINCCIFIFPNIIVVLLYFQRRQRFSPLPSLKIIFQFSASFFICAFAFLAIPCVPFRMLARVTLSLPYFWRIASRAASSLRLFSFFSGSSKRESCSKSSSVRPVTETPIRRRGSPFQDSRKSCLAQR